MYMCAECMHVHVQVYEVLGNTCTLYMSLNILLVLFVCTHITVKTSLVVMSPSPSLLQEKQFTIIHEVLGDTKLNELNEQERRSLAFLKEATRKSSMGTPQ